MLPAGLREAAIFRLAPILGLAGASPRIGARPGFILAGARLESVGAFGVQSYLLPHDPAGPALLAGIIRSLVATIVQHGIATLEQLDLATLEARIGDELKRADAVVLPATLVGAGGDPWPTNLNSPRSTFSPFPPPLFRVFVCVCGVVARPPALVEVESSANLVARCFEHQL